MIPSLLSAWKHRARHQCLHQALDELVADWITQTGRRPSSSSITRLLKWSYAQSVQPDHPPAESTSEMPPPEPDHQVSPGEPEPPPDPEGSPW